MNNRLGSRPSVSTLVACHYVSNVSIGINWISNLVLRAWIASRTAAELLAFLSNHLNRRLTEYGFDERNGVEIWVIPG